MILLRAEREFRSKYGTLNDSCGRSHQVLTTHCREIEAKSDSAAFAFTLATLIGNEGLIAYTAKRAVLLPDLQAASFHAAQEWKERLVSSNIISKCFATEPNRIQAAWRTMKAANDLLALRSISKDPPLHNGLEHCRRGNCPGTDFWKQACGNAVGDYDICCSPPFSLVSLLEHPQLCSTYTSKIQDHAEKFEQETSKWPDFPVQGLAFGEHASSTIDINRITESEIVLRHRIDGARLDVEHLS